MFYRLGIDIGETSIGWFILQLDKKLEICDIVDGGVYIFPDGREAVICFPPYGARNPA